MYNYKKSMLLFPVVLLSNAPLTAHSTSWRITPAISVNETYTDNVDLDSSEKRSDFVTEVTPELLITSTGPQLDLSLLYAPIFLYYPGSASDKSDFRQNLQAEATSEFIRDTFFVDGSASISQQFQDRRRAISAENANRTQNRRTVQAYRLSPYLVKRMGTWAVAKLRYDVSYIRQRQDTLNTIPNQSLGNSFTNMGTFSIANGSRFNRLGWTLTSRYSSEERANSSNYKNTTLRADASYQLIDIFALLGSVGYEKRDASGSFADFKGFIWDSGFRLTPGPRTSLSFRYGNQYNGRTYSLSSYYKLTSKNTATLSYSDAIQTNQSFAFNNNTRSLSAALFGSDFINGDLIRRKRWNFNLSGTRGRTTYGAAVFYNKYKSDDATLDEKRYGGSISLQRRLSSRLDIGSSFSYNLSRFLSDNVKDKFWSASANVNYKISKSLLGTLSYVHSNRDQARQLSLNGGSNYISLSIRAEL